MRKCYFHVNKNASHVRDEWLAEESKRNLKIGLCGKCAKLFRKTAPRDLVKKLHLRRIDEIRLS